MARTGGAHRWWVVVALGIAWAEASGRAAVDAGGASRAGATSAPVAPARSTLEVSRAIETSVRGLMAPVAEVVVVVTDAVLAERGVGADAGALNEVVATPDAGARTGVPARFGLWRGRIRAGYAVATVTVRGSFVRARRALARDEVLTAEDVETADGELRDVVLQRAPGLDQVVGAMPRRAIAAGEWLTAGIVRLPTVVRMGDMVRATIRGGGVEVSALVMAVGSGQVGDVIRVRGAASRRFLNARITARGAVEVIQ